MTKRAIVVWGGWEGHQPRKAVDLFVPHLQSCGFEVRIADSLDIYTDEQTMNAVSLIVQCWTQGEATAEQVAGLCKTVARGAGLAGWHGGLIDAFRNSTDYQFLTGGQFVWHPPALIDYEVEIVPAQATHPIVAGIERFRVHTEQYYNHVDPANLVLATTTHGEHPDASWVSGVVMPTIWIRHWGAGRIFVSSVGHFPADLEVPEVRTITRRGLLWAADDLPA